MELDKYKKRYRPQIKFFKKLLMLSAKKEKKQTNPLFYLERKQRKEGRRPLCE